MRCWEQTASWDQAFSEMSEVAWSTNVNLHVLLLSHPPNLMLQVVQEHEEKTSITSVLLFSLFPIKVTWETLFMWSALSIEMTWKSELQGEHAIRAGAGVAEEAMRSPGRKKPSSFSWFFFFLPHLINHHIFFQGTCQVITWAIIKESLERWGKYNYIHFSGQSLWRRERMPLISSS